MSDSNSGYILGPGQAEKRWMEDTFTFFLATGDQTSDAFCLVDETAPRGMSVPLHRHPDDMESFYVLEGEMTLFVGDGPGVRAPAGSFAHVPGGTVHGFRVESDQARYLILTTARHGEFYKAITLASGPDGEPPQDSEGSTTKGVGREYGIEFVGPLPD
jgi:quercetin dioxygenase-like cupin family protein